MTQGEATTAQLASSSTVCRLKANVLAIDKNPMAC
jgi:hypothetical protein